MENKWKVWIQGLRSGEKLPKKTQLLILLLTGVLLLVIVVPVPDPGGSESSGNESGISSGRESESTEGTEEYEEYLEEKTARVLEDVEGVGKTTVMITLKSSGQKVIEKDSRTDSQDSEEEDSSGGTRVSQDSSSEQTSVYEQGTDGSQTPYVSMEKAPEIEGVVVIADGGGNAVVARNITEAVQALFGVEAHKIKIMKRADT